MRQRKRVALYLRVSTSEQTTKNQRRELVAVAKRHNWQVVAVFEDAGVSGAKGRNGRPGLDALMKAVTRREIDMVAAWSVDRLGRSLMDLLEFLKELHAKGVDLFLHQQGLDTSTPSGRAMFQMMGVFAEFERAMIRERVLAGLARARSEGRALGRKRLEETDAGKVAAIRSLRAAGAGLRRISRELGVGVGTVMRVLGIRYGQKHYVEMERRPIIREALAKLGPNWRNRLGPDHVVELDLIGQLAAKNIPSPTDNFQVAGEGFAAGRRYIPGRNLIMLSMCASVAFRRGIRTLVCGTSETEYSGYPDCRDVSMRAVETAINLSSGLVFKLECPLMWLNKAGVWALAQSLGGPGLVHIIQEDTHTCYLGSREIRHDWGYGCGACDACKLREKGWREFCCQ